MIAIIVAHDLNRGIGFKGTIPWKIKEDMRRFKEITTGHIVVMGRKTYESIGKALPKRINIIVTRNEHFKPKDAIVFHSLEEALAFGKNWDGKLVTFVIGGGEIYKESMQYVDEILATEVIGTSSADTYFPEIDNRFFELQSSEVLTSENGSKFRYISYGKKKN